MDTNTKDRLIFAATIAGTAIAILALGYAVGKDTNEGTANFLREKYTELERRERILRAEYSSLKVEIEQLRISKPGQSNYPTRPGQTDGPTNQGKYPAQSDLIEVDLRAGATEIVFGGKLILSMIESTFEGNPLRHKISATLGSPGAENLQLENVDVGYRVEYHGFEIRVVTVGSGTAKVLVQQRLSK